MRVRSEWILLAVLCALDHVTGRLREPFNLTIESRNYCLFLRWEESSKNPSNVTYSVHYKFLVAKRWKKVPGCEDISKTECDLTHVLVQNYSNLHDFRVRAVYDKRHSPWAYLSNISYMFTVDPAPPVLHIIQENDHVIINVALQEQSCLPASLKMFITYWLEIKSRSDPNQKIPPIELIGPYTVNTLQFKEEVCMAVRTKYKLGNKTSEPSNTECLHFTQQDTFNYAKLLPGLFSCVVAVLLILGICILRFITTQKVQIPRVLDFSHRKSLPVVLDIPHEHYDSISTIEMIKDASSNKHLILNKDNNYPSNRCGYAVRQPLQGDGFGGSCHTGESSSDEYTSSNSNKSSSDSSCLQISGSSAEMALTLDKIQLKNQSEDINTIILGNTETLVPNNICMRPLLDTIDGEDADDLRNVPLNTLSIGAAFDNLEYSDEDFYDSEDDQEQLFGHSTDCGISDSYTKAKLTQSQKNCSSGYEQRSYRSSR